MTKYVNIKDMVGLTFDSVEENGDELIFSNKDHVFRFYHEQNCCESVRIEDICGDLSDLVGSPLLMAEEVDGETPADFNQGYYDSCTWTFYKFATIKGYVDVRWFGTSNGYYSESVDLEYKKKG